MIGVFASFAGFNNPGKNAPKNDAYMNNIAHTNPGIAMPYAHVLLFPMLIFVLYKCYSVLLNIYVVVDAD